MNGGSDAIQRRNLKTNPEFQILPVLEFRILNFYGFSSSEIRAILRANCSPDRSVHPCTTAFSRSMSSICLTL